MIKRATIFCLTVLLSFSAASLPIRAQTDEAAAIKQDVIKRGTGAKVVVIMKYGRLLKGRIGTINDNSFELRQSGSAPDIIAYADVQELEKQARKGIGISKGNVALIAVAALVVIAVVAAKTRKDPCYIAIDPTLCP